MGTTRILAVDDEPGIRTLLKQMFAGQGYEVREAADASEALELVEKERFDLMLFDLTLPGMSGVELCGRVRAKYPSAKIFSMTGHMSQLETSQSGEGCFDRCFPKPFDLDELMAAVKDAVNDG